MKSFACAILMMLAVACGGKNNSGDDGGDDGGDGGTPVADARVPPGCVPAATQCSNCVDDDSDGYIDSYDVECTGPLDNLENSFGTGINGDNKDVVNQDCFFDGNSGGGDDGCNIHVCCLLGAKTVQECTIGQNQYNPAECPPPIGSAQVPQKCLDTCGKLTPPGCDCFGCCTICDPATNQCYDIATNPITSPNCTPQNISDPNACKRCTKVVTCGHTDCGADSCILCPGQDPDDLPPDCNGQTECPVGAQSCANGEACPAQSYCDAGSKCCIGVIALQ